MKENSKLKVKVDMLEENDKKIEINQEKIQQLMADKEITASDMAKMQRKLDILQKDIDNINFKLKVCKDLIEGFATERESWGKHIESHEDEKKNILIRSV